MKIKKSLLASAVALCVVASSPGPLRASDEPRLYPTPSGGSATTTTVPEATTPRTFAWSSKAATAGSKLKLSKVVAVKARGASTYRAAGSCSLRKGVLSFNRAGKCRVSVSVKLKDTGKVLRSSKVFMVSAKTTASTPVASGMPNPVGCTPADKHPQSGTKYPDSSPGDYELQTGWNCDKATLDARPLLEYFTSQGWTKTSTGWGTQTADMTKGSGYLSYGTHAGVLPEGQTFLILTIE